MPIHFDPADGTNLRWVAEIPGMGHSSPIVWGNTIYVTTALPSSGEMELLTGPSDVAGVATADDRVEHSWRLLAFNKNTGEPIWSRSAWDGVPRVHRHRKASHASSTPATNGERIVALLDSEGLFCFDMQGELIWRTDVGILDVGYWGQPQFQWGPATSPVIYEDLVVVQNDRQANSFVAAYSLETGEEVMACGARREAGVVDSCHLQRRA